MRKNISLIMGLHASSHVAIMTLVSYCHGSYLPGALCEGVDSSSLTLQALEALNCWSEWLAGTGTHLFHYSYLSPLVS